VRPDLDLVLPPPVPVGRTRRPASRSWRTCASTRARSCGRTPGSTPTRLSPCTRRVRPAGCARLAYGDLLRDGTSVRLRAELGWYASLLSPSRDLEVFGALLTSLAEATGDARPAEYDAATDFEALAGALVPWLQARRARSHESALADVRSARASALRRAPCAPPASPCSRAG
jgi:hypothetical protein